MSLRSSKPSPRRAAFTRLAFRSLCTAGVSLLGLASSVQAADIQWVGGSADFNSTGNPGWNGPIPGSGDNANNNVNGTTIFITTDETVNDLRLSDSVAANTGYSQTAGNVTLTGGWFRLGAVAGATGTYTMSGGTLNFNTNSNNNRISLGEQNGGTGILNVNGGVVTNGTTGFAARPFKVGGGGASDGNGNEGAGVGTGILSVATGGVVNSYGEMWVGQNAGSTGTVNVNGGTVVEHSWLAIGRNSANGTLNINGGTIAKDSLTNGGSHVTLAGIGTTQTGAINMTGGTFTVAAGGNSLWIGETGNGVFNISGGVALFADGIVLGQAGGSGTFNMQNATGGLTGSLANGGGGEVVTTSNFTLGNAGTGTSVVNLIGGTLSLNTFVAGGSSGSKTINLGGTQLIALANSTAFLGGAGIIANIQGNSSTGGLRLNSNGFAATIATALLHSGLNNGGDGKDGGVTKTGVGQLTLSGTNTYTGNTAVNGGVLVGLLGTSASSTSLPGYSTAGRISVASGATLGFGVGTGGFSIAAIDAARGTLTTAGTVFFAGGSSFGIDTTNSPGGAATTYGSTITDTANGTLGFGKFGNNTLTLSGNNTYTGDTIVYGGTLQASAGNPNAFGQPPATSRIILNGGSLDVNGNTLTRSGLTLNGGSLISAPGTVATPTIINLAGAPTSALGVIDVGTFVGGTYAFATPASAASVRLNLTGTGGTAYTDTDNVGAPDIIKRTNLGTPNIASAINLGSSMRYIAAADTGGDAFPELTFSGAISGTGGLTLDNRIGGSSTQEFGSVAFTAANTYTGVTTVRFGRLEITNNASLGAVGAGNGTQIIRNGTLALGGSGLTADGLNITEPLAFASSQSINYNNDALQNNGVAGGAGNTISGSVTFSDATRINVVAGKLTIATDIQTPDPDSPFLLSKVGGGSLVLTGNNAIAGVIFRPANNTDAFVADNSEVVVGNNGGLGGANGIVNEVLSGGRLVLGLGTTSVTIPAGPDVLLTGSGGTASLAGALQAAANTTDTFGGTVTLNPILSATTNLPLAARLGAQAGGTLIVTGTVQESAPLAPFEISGAINPTAGQPDGTVKLMGNNTYTGVTSIIRGNLVASTLSPAGSAAARQSINNNANIFVGTSNTAGERASLTIQDNAIVTNNNDPANGPLTARGITYIAYGTAATNGASIPAATFTIASGALNTQQLITGTSFVGGPATTATYNQTGGAVTVDRFATFGATGTGTNTANISGGTLDVRANAGAGNGDLEVGAANAQSTTINLSGTGAIRLDRNSNLVFGSQGTSGNNTVTQSGTSTVTFYSDIATTAGGTGSLILGRGAASGVNTYGLNGGTLTVPTISRTATTGSGNFNFNGGTLNAAVNTASFINNLTAARVQAGGAIISSNGFAVTIPQALVHDTALGATADGGLTKNGTGTLTLSGVNTYTGNTLITPLAGNTLALSGVGSIASSPVISVGAASTFDVSAVTGGFTLAAAQRLVGGGIVNGALANSGTIAPGPAPTGIGAARLTLNNTLGFNASSALTLEINGAVAGTSYDQLAVGDSVTIGSNVALTLSLGNGFTPLANQTFTLIDETNAASTITGRFTINNVANASTVTLTNNTGSYAFNVNYLGNGNDLTLSLVPEPSTWTALLTGLGLLGMWQRLRRRRSRTARATV